jgi:hypothetical protein
MEGGRRWRLRDEEAGRDPGDEWFWRLELGFALRPSQPLALRIAWEGLRGAETEYDDLGVLPGQRKYDSIAAGLLYRLGNWMLETGITHRASGEAYPSGSSWNFGFNREFQLRG